MPPKRPRREKWSLQNIRRIWSVFFLGLWVLLLFMSDSRHLKGYEVALFLELNPLVWLSNLMTGWTVYQGLALALLIIIPTIFLGRVFCSWICPLGILNQGISRLLLRRKATEEHAVNAYRTLYRLKYTLMTALLVLALFGSLQISLFDPIALVYRSFIISVFPAGDTLASAVYTKRPVFQGGVLISLLFIALLFANRLIPRLWCRALCPLGALLGLISAGAVMRIQRDVEKCTDCKKCLRSCQGACDPHVRLRVTECHVCMNCISHCPETALHYGLPTNLSSVHRPVDIHRRRLVETAIAGLLFFPMLKISLTSESEAHAAVIRPPGSLPEPEFLRRCIKCSLCMRVCPTNVLQPALLEGGLEGLWTPILVNKIGYCEYHCVLCGQVCPTGAIRKIRVEDKVGVPSQNPVKLGTAFYDRNRCLPWAMNVECIVCEEVCPTSPKAIWFEEKQVRRRDGSMKKLKLPSVDPTLCVGCGICENKCPMGDLPSIRVTSIGESRSKTNRMILQANSLVTKHPT